MSDFNHEVVENILKNTQMGLWQVEVSVGKPPRFLADEVMDLLLGISEEVTPEERFVIHHGRIHPDDLEIFENYSAKLKVERTEVVYRYIHPEWGIRFVRCGGVRFSGDKDRVLLVGTHQDISGTVRLEQDKMIETQLAEANLQLVEKLELISAFGNVYNGAYYVDLINDHYVELTTKVDRAHDIIGVSGDVQKGFDLMCQEIAMPRYADEMREFINMETLDERLKERDWISQQFEGRFNGWTEANIIVAKRGADGRCEHFIWATRNIEDTKRLEIAQSEELRRATKQAQIANKSKTTFLFNMSHDIRTPMNAIIGFTDLLEKNMDDREKSADYLQKIRNSSDFLLSLINNVLEMARIESGKLTLDEKKWNTYDMLNSIYAIFEEPMRDKNITFVKEVDIQHPYVYCDTVKVREIFLNILSNACKYTANGGQISLRIKELEFDRKGYVKYRVTIQDNGIGMSKDYIPKLFDEFSRESTVTDTKIEGTGLGMSIVKKLVEFLGGSISVESDLGKGTTFTVDMIHKIADDADGQDVANERYHVENIKGRKILLAEDNELNAEIAITILEEAGCIVEWAENGQVCVDKIKEADADAYDLILMDVQMPVMNGYVATEEIRAMEDPKKKRIPIYAMTANAFAEDKKAAKLSGMNGHLAKPINVSLLLETISNEFE